jgi:hypothetical protein
VPRTARYGRQIPRWTIVVMVLLVLAAVAAVALFTTAQ